MLKSSPASEQAPSKQATPTVTLVFNSPSETSDDRTNLMTDNHFVSCYLNGTLITPTNFSMTHPENPQALNMDLFEFATHLEALSELDKTGTLNTDFLQPQTIMLSGNSAHSAMEIPILTRQMVLQYTLTDRLYHWIGENHLDTTNPLPDKKTLGALALDDFRAYCPNMTVQACHQLQQHYKICLQSAEDLFNHFKTYFPPELPLTLEHFLKPQHPASSLLKAPQHETLHVISTDKQTSIKLKNFQPKVGTLLQHKDYADNTVVFIINDLILPTQINDNHTWSIDQKAIKALNAFQLLALTFHGRVFKKSVQHVEDTLTQINPLYTADNFHFSADPHVMIREMRAVYDTHVSLHLSATPDHVALSAHQTEQLIQQVIQNNDDFKAKLVQFCMEADTRRIDALTNAEITRCTVATQTDLIFSDLTAMAQPPSSSDAEHLPKCPKTSSPS